MKITVLDGYTENPGDLSWKELEKFGQVTVYDRTDEDEIIKRIGDSEIVVTNKTPITKKTMEACPNLQFISVLATGYNVVDTETARERNIPVSNVPGYGTAAVSQFAIGLLLEVCHRIGHHDEAVHMGRWEKNQDWCFWDYPLIELAGKTMGIIGFGRIGQATGKVGKALGMRILANDPHPNFEGEEIGQYTDLDTLLETSDVIVLHCNLTKENEGLINRKTIDKMKPGVILINNARGQLIVEQDLADALRSGKVGGAGLDVVSHEPIRGDNPLLTAPNCIITPHISWASKESRQRIMDSTVNNIQCFLQRKPVNVVNP